MRNKIYLLWGLFFCVVILGVVYAVEQTSGIIDTSLLDLGRLNLVGKSMLGLAIVLVVLHSIWTQGIFLGTVLLALSFMAGLVAEVVGLKYGTVFGGFYVYENNAQPAILGVPLLIPFIWMGFIYAGYSITASSVIWLNRMKPTVKRYKILYAAAFAATGAFVVLAIDLVMEPLQVNAGNWKWLEGGSYFGIPAGNFLGWFLVAFLAILVFKILQKNECHDASDIGERVLLIPVAGYGLLCAIFFFWALRADLVSLAFTGLLVMAPTVIGNVVAYLHWRTRQQSSGILRIDVL